MKDRGSRKLEKTEKIAGYVLLVIGLVFIILPACLALWIFLSGTQMPTLIPIPAASEGDYTKAVASFSNVCLIFFIFIITVWAGSIVSSRGVAMVKDVKLRLVRKSLKEASETIDKRQDE